MDCNLEHFKLLHRIQKLPLWIIEYAWAHKITDIQEAVAADEELSLWPEVDLESLTLEESWRLRVASAQAYSIVRRRDIGQFEKVVALLEATHRLVPGLVSPIKHMKIMFGLKTMIVMWMLKNDKGIVDTVVKILQYFPSKLPQYHDQCSCHDMYLMRKNHQDFKTLAQTLAMDKNKLQNYVTEQMEEQYGESYAHKLEDRLLHYLQELETVLPRQTYIDELLKEERPRTEEERLLLGMITLMITPVSTSLKRLLHCVLTSSSPGRVSQKADQVADKCVSCSKDAQHAGPSEVILVPVERRSLVEVKPQEMKTMADVARHLSEDSPLLLEEEEDEDSVEGRSQQRTTDEDGENVVEEQAMEKATSESSSAASDMDERASDGKERSSAGTREEDGEREMHVEGDDDKENENSERSDDSALENVPSPRFWCKRHRWVKSILHECSDEQPEQLQVQHDFSTSPTTLFKLSSSTSSSQDLTPSPPSSCPVVQNHPDSSTSSSHDLTPALPFSCPLAQSHPASLTSTPNETVQAQDSNEMPPTDKSVSGLVGLPPTVLQTKDSEMVTLLSPVHPLKYSTASNIDIPDFQPQINLQLSPPHATTSRQQHVLSCLPEPVASLNSYTLSNKDALTFQNASSTSTGWPAPTRRPLSRLSRRFQRNHVTTSRHQHALSNPSELVAFTYSYTLTLSNKDSTMSQNASTSTRRSQASSPLNQIASHVDRTQVRMSPKCQSVFLQSKLLQPLVRLTRLSQQECRGVTEGRSLTLEEDGNNEMKTMAAVALHLPEFDSPLLLEDEEDEDSVEVRSQQRTTDEDGENVVEEQATEKAKSESSSAALDMDERASDGKDRSAPGTREEDGEREMHVEGDDDKENENSERSDDDSARENVPSPRFWCKRHRWVKSILHECSDEQLQVQHDFSTSPTTLFKLSSSTSSSQDLTPSPPSSCPTVQSHPDSSTSSSHDLTPALPFSCPLAQSHPASLTSTPNETVQAQDSNEMPPTDKSVSGLVGLPPTVLQTKDSEMVTLLSPVHPLKYSTASNIDIPDFQPQINLQLSPPHVTTSRQQHVLSCLPEPVASLNISTLSNKDALTFQNVSSTSTGWPAPTRRPLSRLSRRFQRNHVTTSRHQYALSNPPELVAFPYSYTLTLSNRDSTMSQNASTSTGCLSPPRRPLSRLSRSFQRNGRVVCRSQSSTPLNHIPEQSGTHRRITSLAIHSQPVAVPQTCNSALSSPCVPWDLNTRLNTHQAQILPCSSTISHSISQIAIHVDRTQVRMSPQCQSVFLQSKLLQPLVRLTRLSQQECRGVTEGRSLTLEEDGNNEDEESEVGDGIQDLTDTSFNLNSLYSSDESFDSDNEDSCDSDPDYIPPKEKKQRVQDYESYLY